MRLLVLTHTFPPSTHANAKRPFYIVRACLEAGWQVDVVTSPLGLAEPSPECLAHPALRVLRLDDPLGRLLRRSRANPALFRLLALAAAGLLWPDTSRGWAQKALRIAVQQGRYDRSLAFILPASLLLSGRVPGLVNSTWTFDYQEPVTPQQRRLRRRSPLQRVGLPRLAALERQTLARAGCVVFTAETNRQAYIAEGLVNPNATAHIPYFFDAAAFAGPAVTVRPDFEIVYFGTFDWRGARSPETFLRALAGFLAQTPEARARTRFIFYGTWLPDHTRLLDELRLRDVVALHPPLAYADYLRALRESQVLLLVVASAHALFMPSKIVDYFGAGRPILAFVPRQSEMRHVLDQAGMAEFACDEGDVAGGVAALTRLWARYQANTLTGGGERVGFWSSATQLPRYLEVLRAGKAG